MEETTESMQTPVEGTQMPEHRSDGSPTPDWTVRSLGVTDDAQMKQLRRHTTNFGRIATAVFVLGAIALAVMYGSRHKGYETRMQGVEAAGRLANDADMLKALRDAYHKTQYDDVKERVLLNLGHFKDKEALPEMIDGLGRRGIVRRAAALAIARIGNPTASAARNKLLEVLPKTDERDRPQVVWALAVLRESAAADAILEQFKKGLLQSQPGFDPKVIADVLGPERLASPEIIGNADVSIRTLAAQALAEGVAHNPGAESALSTLVQDEMKRPEGQQSAEVIRAAAIGLARGPKVSPLLLDVLNEKKGIGSSVLDALGHNASAPAIVALAAESKEPKLRLQLLRLLRSSHDARVADPLAAFLNDDDKEIVYAAALALGELGDKRAAPALINIAGGIDDRAAKEALSVLSLVPSHGQAGALADLLKRQPGRKANILIALGASGAPQATSVIIKALSGDDAHAASIALARTQDAQGYAALRKMIPRPANRDMSTAKVENEDLYRTRLVAVQAAAAFGKADLTSALETVVNDALDDGRIRRAAAKGMGRIASDADVSKWLEALQSQDTDAAKKRLYALALWQTPRPALVDAFLATVKKTSDIEVQQALGLSIGFSINDKNTIIALVDMLHNAPTRRAAALALVLGGDASSATSLQRVLSEDKELDDVVRHAATAEDSEWLGLITPAHLISGELMRRLSSLDALRGDSASPSPTAYLWNHMMTLMRADVREPGQVDRPLLRTALVEAVNGTSAETREVAAKALAGMGEYGVLNAIIDGKAAGADAARIALRAR